LQHEQLVSWWTVLLLYLAPALSSLLQLALSRTREFDADLEAVGLTGDPLGLASALRRLENYTGRVWEDLMFPVPARRVPQPSLLRSHPTNDERISRLLAVGNRRQLDPIVIVEQPMISLVGVGPIEMRPRYRWPGLWF
jgi:Zn-dependent protease with chaperone function